MRRRGLPAAGATLLEVMIAFAVSAVALGIATQLFLESQRRLAYEARRLTDPAASLALQQLRADVLAATAVAGDLQWSSEPLTLGGLDDRHVRYALAGDTLVRTTYDPAGTAWSEERPVLQGVTTWRWRRLLTPEIALAIEVGYRETQPFTRRIAGGQREPVTPIERQRSLLVTPRGSGGRSW